jgi:hypothetical protein
MAKVRLTIRPWEEITVPDDEVQVLASQGLLVQDEAGSEGSDDDGPGTPPAVTNPAGTPAGNGADGAQEDA